MTDYFLDSSAVLKRYIKEEGSDWIRTITEQRDGVLILAQLTLVEVAAAIAAKSRAPNSISARHRERILERFLDDVAQQYLIIPLRHAIVDHAVHLTQIYRLRGYDAIQLATALVILSSLPPANRIHFRFVANDQDLLDAANAEGLHIDNPVQQP